MLVLRGGTVVDADADRTIDATDRYVAPGLIDAHVHLVLDGRADASSLDGESATAQGLRAAAHLREAVRAGITTVRDLGGPPTLAVDAREAVAHGTLAGPRVVPACSNITMTGGHGHQIGGCEVDGPTEARKAARRQL